MIQPLRRRASARSSSILGPRLGERAGDEQLVGRAEVRAPEDLDAVGIHRAERAVGIEHHDEIVDAVGPAVVRQPPPGGDLHGAAHPVQRDPMARGERVDAADARDDLVLEGDRSGGQDAFDDVDRAVVQRRVAPHQQAADGVVGELVAQRRAPHVGAPCAPVVDRSGVGGGPTVARRVGQLRRSCRTGPR